MTSRFDYPPLARYPYWSIDTETTGLQYPVDRAFGVSFAVPDGTTWYVDIRHHDIESWLADQIAESTCIIGFNAAFDFKMLIAAGLDIPVPDGGVLHDGMIRACLIDEHLSTQFPWTRRMIRYSLDDLCEHYLKQRKDESLYVKLAELFGGPPTRSAQIERIHLAPPEVVAPYAERDALLHLRLWEHQEKLIIRDDLREIDEFERRITPTVIRATIRGVPVDPARAEQAREKLTEVINEAQARLDQLCGLKVNVNSPKQVRAAFGVRQTSDGHWETDTGFRLALTDGGQPSMDREALDAMEDDPRAQLIDEVRSMIKTRDTFLGKYICKDSYNNTVYPTINQTAGESGGTRTGRFSYVDPAMQQIPSRNKAVAEIVKSCFPAPEGMAWVDSDLNSFEVRVFAHLVARYNDALLQAYEANPRMDFHQWVAILTGLPRNATRPGEANAKQLNLSMIFNSGRGAIAAKMGMPWEWAEFTNGSGELIRYRKPGPEASEVIDRYHERIQGVKMLADRMKRTAESRGWIQTMFGRRLRFPKGFKAYKASGILIQATAADINKENWVLTEQALGKDGHLILNTHDSYSMAIEIGREKEAYARVQEAIQRPVLRVPLLLDYSGAGATWWDAISGG